MLKTQILSNHAKKIWWKGLAEVLPEKAVHDCLCLKGDYLQVHGNRYKMQEHTYLIGFGKAVARMAIEIENILSGQLKKGIISVPIGTKSHLFENGISFQPFSAVEVFEGAVNNMPDSASWEATRSIVELIKSIPKGSLLIVLVSGGGSALLPAPVAPIQIADKQLVLSMLFQAGAPIQEINCVRKHLSSLKGGKLALLANHTKIISLIISDIINDPLYLIASGPTFPDTSLKVDAVKILKKYHVWEKCPRSVSTVLKASDVPYDTDFSHVQNVLLLSNQQALRGMKQEAEAMGYHSMCLTPAMCGDVQTAAQFLAAFAFDVATASRNFPHTNSFLREGHLKLNKLGYPDNLFISLEEFWNSLLETQSGKCCFVLGGETTVKLSGTQGIGGRCQEMCLAIALRIHELRHKNPCESLNLSILAAGSDGIDGPTVAAGAVTDAYQIDKAHSMNLDAYSYLLNHDSFNFYGKLDSGICHFITGHTGTNVMDLIVLLFELDVNNLSTESSSVEIYSYHPL